VAFLRSRLPKMLSNIRRLLLLLAVIALPTAMIDSVPLYNAEGLALSASSWGEILSVYFQVVVGLVMPVLLCLPAIEERVGFRACEAFVAVLSSLIALREVWVVMLSHGGAPAPTALVLDALVTGVHLALPIRWYVMLWTDVLFVVMFTGGCLLQPGAARTADVSAVILSFAGLVAAANLGLRSAELSERKLFTMVADERSLRAQAEFELEKVVAQSGRQSTASTNNMMPSGATPSVVSTVNSGQETTDTGRLFKVLGTDNEEATQELMNLGVKEHWLIEQDELEVFHSRVLGRGGFGLVVVGTFCSAPVAVKTFASGGPKTSIKDVLDELRVLRHVHHPNIVLFYGACLYESRLSGQVDIRLVFERVKGQTLGDFVKSLRRGQRQPLSDGQVFSCLHLMKGVIRAIIYLHTRRHPVVHGDLKPANIMVQGPLPSPDAKLLDFGLSRVVSRHANIKGGTEGFKAPEIQADSAVRASPAVDIFAVGCVLTYLARKHMGASVPERWRPTVDACTMRNPQDRPTAREVYKELFEGIFQTTPALDSL